MDKLLRPADVSQLTGIPTGTLAYWRHRGGIGPRFARLGGRRVVYRSSDVAAWVDEQFEKADQKAAG